MGETEWNKVLQRSRTGALVVPLDEIRTLTYQTKNFISGEFPGSGIYPIASGREAYLETFIVTNLSGIYPVHLVWAGAATALSGNNVSGDAAIVDYLISSGTAMGSTVKVEFDPPLGPYISGIGMVSGGCQMGGRVTAVIRLDPQPIE